MWSLAAPGGCGGDVPAEGAEFGDDQAGEEGGAGGGVLLHDGSDDGGDRVGHGLLRAHQAAPSAVVWCVRNWRPIHRLYAGGTAWRASVLFIQVQPIASA